MDERRRDGPRAPAGAPERARSPRLLDLPPARPPAVRQRLRMGARRRRGRGRPRRGGGPGRPPRGPPLPGRASEPPLGRDRGGAPQPLPPLAGAARLPGARAPEVLLRPLAGADAAPSEDLPDD